MSIINFTFPADSQVIRIFESILVPKFADFDDEIKGLGGPITSATLEVYKQVIKSFLPTPEKSHYLFNMRDVSKVIQGVCLADKKVIDTKDSMLRLWMHESMRVFSDRFLRDKFEDFERFRTILSSACQSKCDMSWGDMS